MNWRVLIVGEWKARHVNRNGRLRESYCIVCIEVTSIQWLQMPRSGLVRNITLCYMRYPYAVIILTIFGTKPNRGNGYKQTGQEALICFTTILHRQKKAPHEGFTHSIWVSFKGSLQIRSTMRAWRIRIRLTSFLANVSELVVTFIFLRVHVHIVLGRIK